MPNNPGNDSPVRKRIDRRTKIKLFLIGVIVAWLAIFFILDLAFHGPISTLLSNRDELVKTVESFGAFAPILYIILQIVQTVVAPIPGQAVGSIGGFLFGSWGILWTLIGSIIGCYIVFRLARHYGRPLIEKIFKKSTIEKFDFILDSKGTSLILFAIFLLPGFPDDLVCYMGGLTKLPIRRLMVLITLGRFPTIVLTNFLGSGLSDNLPLVAVAAIFSVVILGLVVWQRERIMKYLKRGSTKNPAENNTDKSSKSSE